MIWISGIEYVLKSFMNAHVQSNEIFSVMNALKNCNLWMYH